MDLSKLSGRIKFLRIKGPKGKLDQAVVAAAIGLSTNQYQRYEYGKAQKRKNIDKLAVFYGCSPAWLHTNEGNPPQKASGTAVPFIYNKDTAATGEGIAEPSAPPVFPDMFVLIPQVVGSISAGCGLTPDDNVEMRVAFRRDWIARKGRSQNMSLIKVRGDSMEPTLLDGDLVLVDHGRASIASQGGIYAIAIDDEIMIKRVQPVFPDKLLVISDNKQYPTQEIATENVRVNGKVIWFARDLER